MTDFDDNLERTIKRLNTLSPQEKQIYDELIDFYKTQEQALQKQIDELQRQRDAINWRRYEFVLTLGGFREKN